MAAAWTRVGDPAADSDDSADDSPPRLPLMLEQAELALDRREGSEMACPSWDAEWATDPAGPALPLDGSWQPCLSCDPAEPS